MRKLAIGICLFVALLGVSFLLPRTDISWVTTAEARNGFFEASCAGCHAPPVVVSCAGCHAHGVHSNTAQNDINLAGATDKTTYSPGEQVNVTIRGGYRPGWVRAILYNQNMDELSRSTGPTGEGGGPALPVTLSAPAPTTPGSYTWNVAWYGNQYDLAQAGGTTFFGPRWTPDPGNPEHGQEIVATNSFTVAPPAAPAIALVPTSLDLGTVTVGSSATLTTDIQNTGTADLNVTEIARATGTSTEFAFSPPAPITVAPGGSQTLTVTYAPTDAGTDSGSLVITSNASTSPISLALTGTGNIPPPAPPDINLNPAGLQFATVTVGDVATLTTQIQNVGVADLTVTTIAHCAGTSAEFVFTPSAPFTVPDGGSTTLSVTYAPSGEGHDMGCLVIGSNDPDEPSVELALGGTGQMPPPTPQPDINLNPTTLAFGTVTVGSSSTLTAEIQNLGTAALTVSGIASCTGASPEFTWAPATPIAVPPGGNRTLSVTYTPTNAGTDTGCLTLASNDPDEASVSLDVSGTGQVQTPEEPDINVNPGSLAFGAVTLGGAASRTTTIENLGTADLTISSIAACAGTSGEFTWSPSSPFTLPSGAKQALTVTYTPLDVGADTGCLAITSNDPDETSVSLGLEGSGMQAPPPGALDLDIKQFKASPVVTLGQSIRLRLDVKNPGGTDGKAVATLVGMQKGAEVYRETLMVSDPAGNGSTRFEFPAFTPTAAGKIRWIVTIDDQDPDHDTAKATTEVKPRRPRRNGDHDHEGDDEHKADRDAKD